MKRIFSLFALIAIFAVSGCAGPSGDAPVTPPPTRDSVDTFDRDAEIVAKADRAIDALADGESAPDFDEDVSVSELLETTDTEILDRFVEYTRDGEIGDPVEVSGDPFVSAVDNGDDPFGNRQILLTIENFGGFVTAFQVSGIDLDPDGNGVDAEIVDVSLGDAMVAEGGWRFASNLDNGKIGGFTSKLFAVDYTERVRWGTEFAKVSVSNDEPITFEGVGVSGYDDNESNHRAIVPPTDNVEFVPAG